MTGAQAPRRVPARGVALCAAAAVLTVNAALTAPESPGLGDGWRWLTVLAALALCAWNGVAANRAYRDAGIVSVVGFCHFWSFFAFSFPAAEMTYRYADLELGYWRTPTNDPLLFRSVVLIAAFQLLFFLALGRGSERRLAVRMAGSRTSAPRPRIALVFLAALAPLLWARLTVLRELGLEGVATSMVTRTDYFTGLGGSVGAATWLLNTFFPIYAVSFLCLGIKYLMPHPSPTGRSLYLLALIGCAGGVALSGGRAELVYVVLTVGMFMYVQGYRSLRHFAPLLLTVALVGFVLFLVAQARTGESNLLSRLAGNPYVGYSYAPGDTTQILGLGRFDAVTMILDKHGAGENLHGQSYLYALLGGANTTFLPRIALGFDLPTFHVSNEVLGYWVFGGPITSVLPSAPGELYINMGWVGVAVGALVLGLLARTVQRCLLAVPGPLEFPWLLVVWTLARLLSDESYLIATFVTRNLPAMIAVALLLRNEGQLSPRGLEPSSTAEGPTAPVSPAGAAVTGIR